MPGRVGVLGHELADDPIRRVFALALFVLDDAALFVELALIDRA